MDRQYIIKHTTSIVRGRLSELKYRIDPDTLHRQPADSLGLNDIGRIGIELFHPILCDEYQRNRQTGSFILIDPRSNFTVGGGLIIDRSHRYRSSRREAEPSEKRHITRHHGHVAVESRARVLGQQPVTLWLTGLSGSGKSTLAYTLEKRLIEEGRANFVLDGDNVRQGLNRDLGFSPEDRCENIRRVAEVARLFNEAGLIVITSFISPFARDRLSAREIISEGRFIEVFVDTSLEVCEQRDPKGLYAKARAGEIPEFTGISSPYEPPADPEIHLNTAALSVNECVDAVMAHLKEIGVLE
jgi:bifunctional enzyme CysN/CysC